MQEEKYNDRFLVIELKSGSEKAFQKLFEDYRDILYKYCYGMVGSKVYAEEIVQEVFMKVWLKREVLNPELSFKSYLFTITRNKTITFLRKAAKSEKLREEIFYNSQRSVDTTDLHICEQEVEKVKERVLDLLPPRRRLIFEMSRYEGKSYEEIATELGISQNTVRNQVSRALETLRDFLLKGKGIFLVLLLFHKSGL